MAPKTAKPRRRRHYKKKGYSKSLAYPSVALCVDKQFVKLRYAEIITHTLPIQDTVFYLNQHTDCNVTAGGVGKYARGAAQWNAFYNKAYVTSSKFTVKCISNGAPGTTAIQCTIYPSNTSNQQAVSMAAQERSRRKTTIINATSDTKILSHKASTKSILGNNRESDWNFICNPTGVVVGPAETGFWHVVTELVSGAGPTPTLLMVEIEYNVCFFDRKGELGAIVGPTGPAF